MRLVIAQVSCFYCAFCLRSDYFLVAWPPGDGSPGPSLVPQNTSAQCTLREGVGHEL